MKTFVTCLLVAMFCVTSINADAGKVLSVVARLLGEQEQAARKRDASMNLEKIHKIREIMVEKLEEMIPVVDDHIKTVKRNVGIRELSEEMIEQGLKSACARGTLDIPVEFAQEHDIHTKFITQRELQPLCEAMNMPWMNHSDDL